MQGSSGSGVKVLGLKGSMIYQSMTPMLKFLETIKFDFVCLSKQDKLPEPIISRFQTVKKYSEANELGENDIQLFLRSLNESGFIESGIKHNRESMLETKKVASSYLPYKDKVLELLDNGS
jgi:hypothetical protein